MTHRCYDDNCPHCQNLAEHAADNQEPDYDPDAAADQYERWLGL